MSGLSRRSLLAAVGVTLTTSGCLTRVDDYLDRTTTATETTRTAPPSPTGTTTSVSETTTATTETTTPASETTTPADEPTHEDGTTTDDWIDRALKTPDPDHEISLANDADEARTIRVRVVREQTGKTVFEATREVSPGAEIVVYNLKQADPEGVEGFRVCGELVDRTTAGTRTTTATRTTATTETPTTTDSPYRDCATIDTNECYGNAHVTARADGSVHVVYAIC